MGIELGQLEAFILAARLHSFSRAAAVIGVTQPSLSTRILSLENAVGEQLFRRVGRGVQLTAAGEILFPFVRRALNDLEHGLKTLESSRVGTAGELKIGATRSVSASALPGIISAFRERYPGVEISVKTERHATMVDLLVAREIQVGIGRALYHPEVETMLLFDEQIVLVTHPEHRLARQSKANARDVAGEPLVVYDRQSTFFVLVEKVLREAGVSPNVTMELDTVEATKRMIERGLGISFLPANAVQIEVELGRLARVELDEGSRITLPIAAMCRTESMGLGIVASFLGLLGQIYGQRVPEAVNGGAWDRLNRRSYQRTAAAS